MRILPHPHQEIEWQCLKALWMWWVIIDILVWFIYLCIISEVDKVGVSSWGLPAQVVLRAPGPWSPGLAEGEGFLVWADSRLGQRLARQWSGSSRRVKGVRRQLRRKPWWGPSNYKKKPSALGWLLTCFECCCGQCRGQDFSQADGIFLARMNFLFIYFYFEMSGLEVNTRVCCNAGGWEDWRRVWRKGPSPITYWEAPSSGARAHPFSSSLSRA